MTSLLTWNLIDNSSPGYDALFDYGTYTVAVIGVLQDNSHMTQQALTFNIVIDCCVLPTVISGPSAGAALYTYNVDALTMSIPLIGSYAGDNACCAITSNAPTIVPISPAGLFTLSTDNLTNSVYSNDISLVTGPGGGYYTFTYSAPLQDSGCYTVPSVVTYDVSITNLCGEAILAIDPVSSIFLPIGTPSVSYTIMHSAATLSWDSSSNYSSSVGVSDPCGNIVDTIWDVTSGS